MKGAFCIVIKECSSKRVQRYCYQWEINWCCRISDVIDELLH